MGLLSKGLGITWTEPVDIEGIIPCKCGMHLLMAVFTSIGHLYDDARLGELLFESFLLWEMHTQKQNLEENLTKSLQAFQPVDEAILARFLLQFKKWCSRDNKIFPDDVHCHLCKLLFAIWW